MTSLPKADHIMNIPLEDIKFATNNFDEEYLLAEGGFGSVYKGQLHLFAGSSEPGTTVAVKRLDVKRGQGQREFNTEILMLSHYKHENVVSLLGFSDEGNEKVLVYKYEDNGSLDNHLAPEKLTCEQRLRICVGVARGLNYLHCGVGKEHRVIHRDIKSSNILLDANWDAKISDFGLSKISPANPQFTILVTNVCGTPGYIDPQYLDTGILTKESDVYSFGVVLFEVLCGRVAFIKHDEHKLLSKSVQDRQKEGTLHDIIIPNMLEQMKPCSRKVFINIALQCLAENRKDRPRIGVIVKDLDIALEHQLDTRIIDSVSEVGLRTELWGSMTGGFLFYFRLESNQKLRKIKINHGEWIHSLTFEAEDSNCLLHASRRYGGPHDGTDKAQMTPIDFDAEEEIIKIYGTVGSRENLYLVTTLCFVTNKNEYGPFGEKCDDDTHFSESWKMGLFDGFYGRYGWYLDALGCCLKTN